MTDFSASDAAIEGFNLARRKPRVILAWSLAQFVVGLVVGAVMVLLIGSDMQTISDPPTAAALNDPTLRNQTIMSFLRIQGVTLPLGLAWAAVQSCAVYRAVLRPEDKGLAYLKLGGDELRMLGLLALYVLLGFAACFVIVFALSFVAAIAMMAAGAQKDSVAAAVAILSLVCAIGLFGWISVRLSLAGPMTFAQRRIGFRGSWVLTRGRFWALSGTYLVSSVLAGVVGLLGVCTALIIGFIVTRQSPVALYQLMFHADFGSLAAYFAPSRLVVMAVQALFLGLFTAVWYAAPAAAYQMLSGSAPTKTGPATAAVASDRPAAPTGPWG
jgi:hypothetical protein